MTLSPFTKMTFFKRELPAYFVPHYENSHSLADTLYYLKYTKDPVMRCQSTRGDLEAATKEVFIRCGKCSIEV